MERTEIQDRYISLLTDFGFKRIFGSQPNKELLIGFLNAIFQGVQVIRDVKYLNSEKVGDIYIERKAIFDVYCENERGEKFIVEMQNAHQKYFKDRSLYYVTFPIREQAPKGADWDFHLTNIYVVALLNFDMEEEAFDKDDICHDVALVDTKTFKIFNRTLWFKYVEIGKFRKPLEELTTLFDKWIYALRNLSRLSDRPKELQEKIFDRLFAEAEIAKFNREDLKNYEDSLKTYRDLKNSIDTALEQGRLEGREEGIEIGIEKGLKQGREEGKAEGILFAARQMLQAGMSAEQVSTMMNLPISEVEKLKHL